MMGSYTVEDLKKVLKRRLYIFGECVLEIEEQEDGKKIKVVDKDIYDGYIDAKGKEVKDTIDMSTVPLVLYTNKENVIDFIEHRYGAFTKANKDSVLFVANLIGKTIIF